MTFAACWVCGRLSALDKSSGEGDLCKKGCVAEQSSVNFPISPSFTSAWCFKPGVLTTYRMTRSRHKELLQYTQYHIKLSKFLLGRCEPKTLEGTPPHRTSLLLWSRYPLADHTQLLERCTYYILHRVFFCGKQWTQNKNLLCFLRKSAQRSRWIKLFLMGLKPWWACGMKS